MHDEPASTAAALRRRLRDDPAAGRALEELRRAAYGRAGSDAPLVEVPAALRARTGSPQRELPAPLVALLAEEARLVDEGAALLAAERVHGEAAGGDPMTGDPTAGDPTAGDQPADDPVTAPRRRRVARGPLAALIAGAVVLAALGTASATGLLDGVAAGAPGPTAATAATAGDPAPDAATTPRGQAMGTPDGRRGAAVPDFSEDPPVPVPATDEELAAERTRAADALWAMLVAQEPDAVRPDVGFERTIAPGLFAEVQVGCLREAGIDASVIGSDSFTYPDGDAAALYACAVRFPMAEAADGPRDDAGLAYLHDYYVAYLLPCYAAEGKPYEGEVPARDEFIAATRAGDPWTPFPAAMDPALAATCPATPAAYR